jgi:hypothetical protein
MVEEFVSSFEKAILMERAKLASYLMMALYLMMASHLLASEEWMAMKPICQQNYENPKLFCINSIKCAILFF